MARVVTDADADEVVITDAMLSKSEDIARRERRYLISMGIRVACFMTMFFVPGIWKIASVAGAAVIPAVAVVLANARENRTPPARLRDHPDDEVAETFPMLEPGHVIKGEVVDATV